MDWFLYNMSLRHERVKQCALNCHKKTVAVENILQFTGKRKRRILFSMLSCEFRESFKNTFLTEYIRTTAPGWSDAQKHWH